MHTALSAHVGQPVVIKYDPRDMTSIGVYLSDRLICRATCQRKKGYKVSLKQIMKARKARGKKLKQHIEKWNWTHITGHWIPLSHLDG